MTVTLQLTGERHAVVRRDIDPRVVWTVCGRRIALVGHRRTATHRCPECFAGAATSRGELVA